jgi:hypothetical protein
MNARPPKALHTLLILRKHSIQLEVKLDNQTGFGTFVDGLDDNGFPTWLGTDSEEVKRWLINQANHRVWGVLGVNCLLSEYI